MKTYIEPPQKKVSLNLKELLLYKDLIFILIWREIKIRYKQTIIGTAWAIIQPVISMIVFTLLFDKMMNISSGNIPYPIFSFCALVPWTFFSHSLVKNSRCLIDNRNLLTKVYFPRLIYPLAATLGGFIDFFISFLFLIVLMIYYNIFPSIAIFLLPLFILLNMLAAFGIGLWLSAINVKYRDFLNILPFVTQIWLFITPVAYASDLIPEKFKFLYGLNPIAGVVEGFRWTVLGQTPSNQIVLSSVLSTIIIFFSGLFFFKSREDYFTDLI